MSEPRRTILLVEDNDLLRESFSILLGESGYDVLPAATATDALETTRQARPSLMVLDLGLPDRPGLDLVREIRSDPDLAGMPIVALTGRAGRAEERASLEAGCDRFLSKPVSARKLLSELAALVEA